jgi:DNA polymerase II small subunit
LSTSSSSANISISKVVAYAISHGHQIAPDALKLFQELAKEFERKNRKEPTLESIIALVIEEKVRSQITSIAQNGLSSSSTITGRDLMLLEPDLFDGLEVNLTRTSRHVVAGEHEILGNSRNESTLDAKLEIVNDPTESIRPVGIEGFPQLFKSRYEKLMRILRERPEARQLSKISELKADKTGRVAGLVYSKRGTKNGVELVIDDTSGKLSALAIGDDARKAANEVALDQCVMVEVEGKGGRFFIKNVTQPDVPNRIVSPSKKTVYAVFLSDLHIGSNKFLEGAFTRFLEWLSGKGLQAEEDIEIVKRIKFVIIGGDIVDGVGVFPNQEYELAENNIYKQYEMVSKKIASIPSHLDVLMIPGNHDSTRQALPQPMIPRKYAESLYILKNVTMLGDPALVKLNGVSVLVYHGRSLDDVLATTPGLSYERPAEAMKVLLKARHLAPMFGSRTPIAPETEDHLVIDQVPDIFHAGHVHSVGIENYRGTIIINSGTWQAQTGYQANLGIMPSPGLVPIVNLATLQVVTREFLTTYESVAKVNPVNVVVEEEEEQ